MEVADGVLRNSDRFLLLSNFIFSRTSEVGEGTPLPFHFPPANVLCLIKHFFYYIKYVPSNVQLDSYLGDPGIDN